MPKIGEAWRRFRSTIEAAARMSEDDAWERIERRLQRLEEVTGLRSAGGAGGEASPKGTQIDGERDERKREA